MTWRQQKAFLAVTVLAILYLQASAWDEKDLAELRAEAERAKRDGVRYLVEKSGYRGVYASDFHCRAPLEGERLVMQHANARDPGKGYRCTYWFLPARPHGIATVTWSRSPDLVVQGPIGGAR